MLRSCSHSGPTNINSTLIDTEEVLLYGHSTYFQCTTAASYIGNFSGAETFENTFCAEKVCAISYNRVPCG